MKNSLKKVTKKLAKEIASKFFGRSIQVVDEHNGMYIFESGAVRLEIFPYYGSKNDAFGFPYRGSNYSDFEYPHKYPFAHVIINHQGTCLLRYIDGEIETENDLGNEYWEIKNALFTLNGLLEAAIDEAHIHTDFDFEDRWIVKDKEQLRKALQLLKQTEKLL